MEIMASGFFYNSNSFNIRTEINDKIEVFNIGTEMDDKTQLDIVKMTTAKSNISRESIFPEYSMSW